MSRAITAETLRGLPLPQPHDGGGKEERGRVLVVAGSRELPGPALLAGIAALRVGAGKLQVCTPASIALPLGIAVPEALVRGLPETGSGAIRPDAAGDILEHAAASGAVLIGPGLVNDDTTAELVGRLLAGIEGVPIVLDAAAMMQLRKHRDVLVRHDARVVVTPHAGEMAGILGIEKEAIEADPAGTVRSFAVEMRVVAVLKGATSYLAGPDGHESYCSHGNPGLGTSGSGDTLAGFIAGLLARGAPPLDALAWAVFIHGEAGNRLARSRGPLGFLAREIPDEAPGILGELCAPADPPIQTDKRARSCP